MALLNLKGGISCRTTDPVSSTSRRPKVGRGEKRGRRKEEKKQGGRKCIALKRQDFKSWNNYNNKIKCYFIIIQSITGS